MPYDSAGNLLNSKRALLPWCSGRIATFTKLPVRVRFPSATPQPQNLTIGLLVPITKLGELSKSLEETRGSSLCVASNFGNPTNC